MKTNIEIRNTDVQIFFEAETILENLLLLQIGKRIKSPVETFGSISDNGYAWTYINIPINKTMSRWDATRFGNIYAKKANKK